MLILRNNRLALSAVVTSLIILVIAVLLASVVTYFAINTSNTRVQEESLVVNKVHIWVPSDSSATEAAFIVINTGGRDVVITKICVRGQEACIPPNPDDALQDVCFAVTNKSISVDLSYVLAVSTGGDLVPIDNNTNDDIRLVQATSSVTLSSGCSMVVYISEPDSVSINDVGTTVPITIFTAQSIYYQESNVEAFAST